MRAQYTERLVTRAKRDADFRKRLLDNPKAAVEEELGVELPPDLELRVLPEEPNEAILVLPSVLEPGQLREEELAEAAGGSDQSVWCCPPQPHSATVE
jgi:hypothetical protein